VKLKHLDDWTDDRRHNAEIYDNLFQDFRLMDAVDTPKCMPNRTHVYNQYCIRMNNGERDEMLASLRSQNIGCTVYYPQPLHLQKCFEYLGYKLGDLPESERAANEVIALPIFPELTTDQQAQVVRGIVNGLGRSVPIRTTSSNSQSVRRAA
jgi:dTDP-4-amino-4,6-dideoxygalactose transaminase